MPPPDTEQLYGWFSPSAARMRRTAIHYSTLGGGRVAVTSVSRSMTDSDTDWSDARYMGPVIDFVEIVKYQDLDKLHARSTAVGVIKGHSTTVGVIERRDTWAAFSQVYRARLAAMVEALLKSPPGSC
ncbi:hypothetical protein pqer_cds_660 [Pandoravirus quercus]|uniref:Uncharacterized protein n=1 Tax=Pandoravirus quercus TaxID=2107709 RepID=A0A2U7U9L0_9VIRU|nr:hypothetical protein pqer_cds_660 [Pandoravirus quercus]AVK75082.1 hypothetical protein pqer_cds_660 [Pandoravirus quercus]